ncbi:MAG: hypothetical protein AAGD25_10930 [Cyanobacteria bacterium P01_F01_bin.150]
MTVSTNLAQRLGDFVHPDVPECEGAEVLRILAIGSLKVVNQHVMKMYQLGYAEPHEWSRPLPTPNPNEVMRVLTKRIV